MPACLTTPLYTLQTSLLLPTPGSNLRKRLHSSLQDARGADLNSVYNRRTPLSHRQPVRYSYNNTKGYEDRRHDITPPDDRMYAEDLILQYPSQQRWQVQEVEHA